MEDHFAVAEADAIAGFESDGGGELRAVEQRAVDAAAIADQPLARREHDLGVMSREESVADRDRTIRRAAERDRLARDRDVLRREIRLIDRELEGTRFHWECWEIIGR